jgi:acetyltransferase-like isoleucine patch superfamily enzyme
MALFSDILQTCKNRPFMVAKYLRERSLYFINALLCRGCKGPNVIVGRRPHLLSPFCFRAERPNARITVNDYVSISDRTFIHAWDHGSVTIGHSCSLSNDTVIHCREKITIGNYVLISWNVLIADFDPHSLDLDDRIAEIEHNKAVYWPGYRPDSTKGAYTPRFVTRPVVIEDGVWIGANAIILKGSKIGRGAVIGAGAIVAGEIPPMCMAAGNPARVVKQLEF